MRFFSASPSLNEAARGAGWHSDWRRTDETDFDCKSALLGGALIGLSAIPAMRLPGRIAGITGVLAGSLRRIALVRQTSYRVRSFPCQHAIGAKQKRCNRAGATAEQRQGAYAEAAKTGP